MNHPRSSLAAAWFGRLPAAGPAWLREPLVHFVALGALLFAIDHAVSSRADDPHTIVVGPEVDREARGLFQASRGREPSAAELAALRQVWLDNEVLYREGLALQVDKGDTAIRERVIFKALSVIDAGVKAPPMDEAALRAWFEAHRARYDEPARYDFQEAVPGSDRSEGAVRALVERLNRGTPGDVDASLRVFKDRPHENLLDGYGAEFAKDLEAAPRGEWRAYATKSGWRAMRLESVSAAKPASFTVLRAVVLQDYADAKASEQRSAAVQALAKKYTIRSEGDAK